MPKVEVPGLEDAPEGYEPVDPGVYQVRVTDCESTESKTGKPMVAWEFEIFGEDAPEGTVGRKLFTNTLTAKDNLPFLKKLLVRANIPHTGASFDTEDALGKELRVRVTQKDFEGSIKNEVKDYLPLEE